MLCDTGPLVALVDADDPLHQVCTDAAKNLPPMMVTTWPCLTEAMHFLYRAGGLNGQNALWARIAERIIQLYLPDEADWLLIHKLMNDYADLPLDLADASLVCAAEKLGDNSLFTIDQGLRAIRLQNGKYFDVLP